MDTRHTTTGHADADYIAFDPFSDIDREVKIRCRKIGIVTTRKPQICVSLSSGSHEIPPRTRARREAAIIDGSFGVYYLCLACCDREMVPGFWESAPPEVR